MFRDMLRNEEEEKEQYLADEIEAQTIKQEVATADTLIEDQIGLLAETIRPDSAKLWSSMNKDVVLSNLSDRDIRILTEHWDLAREYEDFGEKTLAQEHLQMAAEIQLSSQGKKGFRSRMLAPPKDIRITREKGKKGWVK